jgi:multidrug efflux pump subunit AcrA (membrane-fusion protein)
MPAQIKEIHVQRGDNVRKGQLLLKLDDAVILQQMEGIKTQLAYAQNIYNRQQKLWDQGIGTEVQLITAKNSVDVLERQLAAANESWKTSFVYAPISGVADQVNVKLVRSSMVYLHRPANSDRQQQQHESGNRRS